MDAVGVGDLPDDVHHHDGVRQFYECDFGYRAQDAHILKRHMRAAVVSCRHAGVGPENLDVEFGVGCRYHDLVTRFACGETAEAVGKRNLADDGKTRRDADHIGFSDADVDGPIGKLLEKRFHARGTDEVGVEHHDVVVFGCHVHQWFCNTHPASLWGFLLMFH